MSDIKVSVSVITYKHAAYIRQCLDSILAQKVNFKYQIVVGEDCSNDGTREILLEYREKYPDIFVLLLNEKNMGASQNGINVRRHCTGAYIASCEGDDFWVDEYKLQKQADFLDSHPEYSAVGTNFVSVSHEGENPRRMLFPWQVGKTYTLKDYLRYGFVIHGSTLMRRNVVPKDKEKYDAMRAKEPTMGDVITRVMLYDFGKIYVLPDVTHAHRDGAQDATSFTATQKSRYLDLTKMYFRIVDNITEFYDGKYDLLALKANRLGGTLRAKLMGWAQFDEAEFDQFWKSLPLKLRLMSIGRCVQQTLRYLTHRIAKKILK